MSDCCSPRGYRRIFSEKRAQSEAKRYHRKGLDSTSRAVVNLILKQGLGSGTLLEIGGGIGAIQLELLCAGARRAVSVELTRTYEETASRLLRKAGLEGRVERMIVDFVDASPEVEVADVVVMNRVVCCYPDMSRLVGAAAAHTSGTLVLSFPKRTWWTRCGLSLGNVLLRLARLEFHLFLHRPDQIGHTAELHGLRAVTSRSGLFWVVAVWERPAAPSA